MPHLSVAEKYRQPEVVDFWRQFSTQGLQACEEAMLARYAPPSATDILDLGCGSGRAGLALEPRGYRVTGLDLTWEMLHAAGELYRPQHLALRLLQANLRAIPCVEKRYDLALILIAALQHIPQRRERQRVFTEIARVLRPGGVLLLALDNLAPALSCYLFWSWRKLASLIDSLHAFQATGAPSTGRATPLMHSTPADRLLESRRSGMKMIAWHLHGIARTLRWRTWGGWIDAGRKIGWIDGEVGDTEIRQVSLVTTAGLVYYHIYQHEELIADAVTGGFRLLGYHSGGELSDGQEFVPRVRQLDKQVLYAFQRLS